MLIALSYTIHHCCQLLISWFAYKNCLSNLYSNLGVILLSYFQGERAVGIYIAATKILRLGVIVASSYTTAIFPYMSRLHEESAVGFKKLRDETMKYMLALVLPLTITLSLFADRIILLLYTDDYTSSIPILRILAWTFLLGLVNPFLSHVLFARGDQKQSLQVAIIKLVFSAAISFWLIPLWGEVGLATATLLSAAVSFVAYLAAVTRGDDLLASLVRMGRSAPAALLLAAFLLLLRNIQLIPLLAMGALFYLLLLFLLRVVSTNDLRMLQKLK